MMLPLVKLGLARYVSLDIIYEIIVFGLLEIRYVKDLIIDER